jgi:hypothetical protein
MPWLKMLTYSVMSDFFFQVLFVTRPVCRLFSGVVAERMEAMGILRL